MNRHTLHWSVIVINLLLIIAYGAILVMRDIQAVWEIAYQAAMHPMMLQGTNLNPIGSEYKVVLAIFIFYPLSLLLEALSWIFIWRHKNKTTLTCYLTSGLLLAVRIGLIYLTWVVLEPAQLACCR